MKKKVRKKYERPMVRKIRLDAEVSVLAVCKTSYGGVGPVVNCDTLFGDPCQSDGS
jgi:hypothetical protein